MADAIKYKQTGDRHGTESLEPDKWEQEGDLLRMDLPEKILFVPFDRVVWIRREKDED